MTDTHLAVVQFADPVLLELLDEADVRVRRGEPRRRVADVANAFATRAPTDERLATLEEAADDLWDDDARSRVEVALGSRGGETLDLTAPARQNVVALAIAYRAALPVLARDERIQAPLRELEPRLSELDADDRVRLGIVLARAAIPALPLNLAAMTDEGYYFVSVFPPEGSEGVDIVGKAAKWLARRMTMDGDAPRVAMRSFLALLAKEVDVDLPTVAETLDSLLAEPVPVAPAGDRLFVALARGLVEEAVADRGFPF